jgi:hypothetical protein
MKNMLRTQQAAFRLGTRIRMKLCAAGTCCAARCFVLGRPDMSRIGGSLRPRIALAHHPRRRSVILIRRVRAGSEAG